MSSESMPPDLAPWLLAYVAEQAQPDEVESWVDRVTNSILTEMPEVGTVEGLPEQVRITVREHWVAFLGDFAQPEQHFHLVEAARRLSVELADRQLPLEMLIRFYRVAQQEVWDYVSELIRALPPGDFDRADLLMYFWNRAGVWLDQSITESVATYEAARSRVLAGAAAQRYESVRAILAAELTDPREASAALGGYPISVHHTAVVLSVGDAEQAGTLESLAAELARRIGAANPLIVKPGGRQLWMWLGTRDQPDLSGLAAAATDLRHESVVVGVGSATPGIAGFVASHREAQGTLRVTAADTEDWLAVYSDVELPVLLGCSPEVDRFMTRQLGPLAGQEEGVQRIRETLTAYLDSGGSAEEAARALVVHRNTIRYRLGQAEEMLGRPITRISPQLAVALRHHDLFHRPGAD
ncbi:helix-turn-helix domain-containing protein [Nocardioides carbamazepini]|uniref:PucR family transcriptional regulator n=1 Tax=Nocardioides carbamazepini TaxID=2854259 RepID=UPI002149E9E6|nr:PucR family transcriptional regulator [Nocardioides carbamazepini]MCR1785144.1 helix-turn-helix domain-containing protein [Nocardioides carbamazepini]